MKKTKQKKPKTKKRRPRRVVEINEADVNLVSKGYPGRFAG